MVPLFLGLSGQKGVAEGSHSLHGSQEAESEPKTWGQDAPLGALLRGNFFLSEALPPGKPKLQHESLSL